MTHRGPGNLQEFFLNQVRKEDLPVTVYLTNGVQLKGVIKHFDNFTILLEAGGVQDLVYKHAVASVVPQRPVSVQGWQQQQQETPARAGASQTNSHPSKSAST